MECKNEIYFMCTKKNHVYDTDVKHLQQDISMIYNMLWIFLFVFL